MQIVVSVRKGGRVSRKKKPAAAAAASSKIGGGHALRDTTVVDHKAAEAAVAAKAAKAAPKKRRGRSGGIAAVEADVEAAADAEAGAEDEVVDDVKDDEVVETAAAAKPAPKMALKKAALKKLRDTIAAGDAEDSAEDVAAAAGKITKFAKPKKKPPPASPISSEGEAEEAAPEDDSGGEADAPESPREDEEADAEPFNIKAVKIEPILREDLIKVYNSIMETQANGLYDKVVGDLPPSKFVPILVKFLEQEWMRNAQTASEKRTIEGTKEPGEFDAVYIALKQGVTPRLAKTLSPEELREQLVARWRELKLQELENRHNGSMALFMAGRNARIQDLWSPATKKAMEQYKKGRAGLGPVEERWDPSPPAAKAPPARAASPIIDLCSPEPPVPLINFKRNRDFLKKHKEKANACTDEESRRQQKAHPEGLHGFKTYWYCTPEFRAEVDALAFSENRDAIYAEWGENVAPFNEDEQDPDPEWEQKLAQNAADRAKQRKALEHLAAVHHKEYDQDHNKKAVGFLLPGGKEPPESKRNAAAAAATKKADRRLADVPMPTLLMETEREFKELKKNGAWSTPKTHFEAARKAADKIRDKRTKIGRTPAAEKKAAELMFRLGLVQARGSTPYAQELLDRIQKKPNKLNAAVAGYMKNLPAADAFNVPLPKISPDKKRPKDADPPASSSEEEWSDAEDEEEAEEWDKDEQEQMNSSMAACSARFAWNCARSCFLKSLHVNGVPAAFAARRFGLHQVRRSRSIQLSTSSSLRRSSSGVLPQLS